MPIKNNGLITIYDTIENIMAKDVNNKFLNYPYIEGQTFYAEDKNIFLEDKNRQRLVKTTFNAIEVMEDGAENFYERGFAGFEGNIILAKSKGFFKLQYVDISGDLHDLTYSDDEMETILTTSSLNGYSSVVLSFYAYAPYNKLNSTIMIADPIISGDYNFRTGVKNITIGNVGTTGWTDDISKLKGEWAYDSSEDEYYLVIPGFYEYRIPSGYEPKLVTSRVLLFDRNEYYTFTDLNGDEASIYRENLNQTPIYLYKAFNDFQEEESLILTLPGDLIYNFKKAEFEGEPVLNGWSILPPAIDETNNRIIYLIGTIAVSGSDFSVIQTIDWGTPKLHNKIPENSTTYWMIRSSNIIELSKEGVFIPNSITFSSKRKVGLNEVEDFGAYFVLEYTTDNTNWTEAYASQNAENFITYNIGSSTIKAIRAKLYKEYDSINYSILLDEETIPVLVEASNTPTLNIGNDNVSIAAASTGFNNLVISSSTVEMFIGTESLTYDIDLTTSKTYKIELDYNNITGSYSVLNNIVTITPDTMSADSANILVTITYKDEKGAQQTITGGINYSLNRQGLQGDLGPQGPQGPQGFTGSQGPGIVYRGEWKAGVSYFAPDAISKRTDVVKGSDNNYYYCIVSHTAAEDDYKPIAGPYYGTRWSAFGETFTSVATGLLLAEESYVKNTINVGTNDTGTGANIVIEGDTTLPYISIGQASPAFGQPGIYLGKWNVGGSPSNVFSIGSGSNYLNYYSYGNGSLQISGDIGGTIGSLIIGTPNSPDYTGIKISSDGIQAYKGSETPTVSIGSNGNASFTGTITATSGTIGNFEIALGSGSGGSGSWEAGTLKNDNVWITPNGFNVNRLMLTGGIWYHYNTLHNEFGFHADRYDNSDGKYYGTQLTYWGLTTASTANALNSPINIEANGNIWLRAGLESVGYVYAKGYGTNNYGQVLASGSTTPSTRIIKSNIKDITDDKISSFLDVINIKEFDNLLTNKKGISLIIEDEEEKNNPYKDILFERVDKLFSFDELPEFLKPYEFDKETIQKELVQNEEHYYFSPKTISSDIMQGIMLASIKYNHERLKVLEEENENLKELIKKILVKVGEV